MIYFENLKRVNKKFEINYSSLFRKFLDDGQYILGNNLLNFEKTFCKFNNVKFTLGCGSGYDALILSLKSLNLPKGSEVLISSNSYIAAIFAIINSGLKPVFIAPDINTYNINTKLIEKKITKKTKCIMPVHMYGLISNMSEIKKIAIKYNLKIVEDCAQALGSKIQNKLAGSYSDVAAFSFYPTKNLGALGDGGAIITNKKKLFNNIIKLRNYGFRKKNYADYIGINSRLDDFQAMILHKKLKFINKFISHKRKLAYIYNNELNSNFKKTLTPSNYLHTYHLYVVRHNDRNNLIKYLKNKNINVSIHYPISPLEQKALNKFSIYNDEISKKIHKSVISLPLSFSHKESEIMKVTKILNSF